MTSVEYKQSNVFSQFLTSSFIIWKKTEAAY